MSNPFDQFDVATAPATAPAPAAAPAQAAPAANPFDQFDAQAAAPTAAAPAQPQGEYGFAPAPPEQQAAPAPAAASPAQSTPAPAPSDATSATPVPAQQDFLLRHGVGVSTQQLENTGSGILRGVRDVIDTPAHWLAEGADAVGLTSGQGDKVAAQNAADRQAYEAGIGRDPDAQTGRVLGQMGVTLPLGGMIGRAAGAVGDAVASGAGQISPTLGAAANRLSQFFQGAGGSGLASQAASKVAQGALQGGTAGVLTSGQSDQPVADQALRGAIVGGIAAPIVGAVGGALGGDVGNAVAGGDPSSEVQRFGQLARDKYGIGITADMVSPSKFVQNLGSQLQQVPFSGMGAAKKALQSQWVQALSHEIGADTDEITPKVASDAAARIGAQMDGVIDQAPSIKTDGLMNDLAGIENDADYQTPDVRGVIQKHVHNILQSIGDDGTITGQQYQGLTNFNSPLGQAMRNPNPNIKGAAGDIKGALDQALQDSLPEGSDAWQQFQNARAQYRALKTIQPLVERGVPGDLNPTALQAQVNKVYKNRGLRAEQPNISELADIGQMFNLRPDSGTAGRMFGNATLAGAGGAAAAAAGGNLLPAAGIVGTLGAGRLASMYLRSPTVINRLLQSGANPAYAGSGVLNSLAPYAAPAAAVLGGPRN